MDPIRPVDREPINPLLRVQRRKPGEQDPEQRRRRRKGEQDPDRSADLPPGTDDEDGRPRIDVRA